MQHDVGDEPAHKSALFEAGVKKGHIEHEDVRALFLGDGAPLVYYHLVVPAQPVDGLDDEP